MSETKMIQCPNCGKQAPWHGNANRPFCGPACQGRDLGRWAEEEYKIESDENEAPHQGGLNDDSSD